MSLSLENITYQYAEKSFQYSMEISDGIVGVFGLSGSGKTTLMNLISGIIKPTNGRMVCNNRVFFDKQKKINVPTNKRNIGVVFQENFLFPHLTVSQNLRYSAPYQKHKKQIITLDAVVHLLDIEDLLLKKPNQLSGGERQRVAIGRTLMSQPELLLLDEPFSNLDRNRRKQIISYLLKINHRFSIPLLIISHDLEDILKLTRTLLIIKNGKVQALGNYLDIIEGALAPDLLATKRYLNILELHEVLFSKEDGLYHFSNQTEGGSMLLKTNSDWFTGIDMEVKFVRFCIFPDDIALVNSPIEGTSFQNQLKGEVRKIRIKNNAAYITIQCGLDLVAEVTPNAVEQMDLYVGKTIYCLIKAKAIEVIHVFKNKCLKTDAQ